MPILPAAFAAPCHSQEILVLDATIAGCSAGMRTLTGHHQWSLDRFQADRKRVNALWLIVFASNFIGQIVAG